MVNSSNDDESPLIYGLEHQARALASQSIPASSDASFVRFLVGTQSLQTTNQIHLLEYLEETNNLTKAIFKHDEGEIWAINCCPKNPRLITTCYSPTSSSNSRDSHCSLFELPDDTINSLNDKDYSTPLPLNKLCDFKLNANVGRTSVWQPEDGNQLMTFEDRKIILWDIESKQSSWSTIIDPSLIATKASNKVSKITTIKWSPHSNCSIIAAALGNNVYARDIRCKTNSSPSSFAWYLPAHSQQVRDVDFNPNAQYYVATCGDDCEYKFWDVRKPSTPAITMLNHSHWVWSIRYNQFHDQLILTCSSDSRVNLTRITSLASQPFGHLLDPDEGDTDPADQSNTSSVNGSYNQSTNRLEDGLICSFEEHEDSVYAAEWSATDPWIFASLSYDGRLVINKVPKKEKFSLLF